MKRYILITVFCLTVAFATHAQAMSAGVGASVDTDVEANDDTGVSASANANATGTMMKDKNDDSTETEESNASDSSVSIDAKNIRGWSDTQKSDFLLGVKSHAELKSDQDLENFAKGVIASDENVDAVSSTETDVEVKYRLPAKFLGIFSSHFESTAETSFSDKTSHEPTEVKVKFPWYRMFFSLDSQAQSDIIENAISSSLDTNISNSTSVYARNGQTIQIISNILKGIRANIQ